MVVTGMSLTAAGCAGSAPARRSTGTPVHAVTAPPTSAPGASSTTTTVPPPFASSVSTVTAGDLGASWHAGCPVDPGQLRALRLSYWGFDATAHTGTMVVNAAVVQQVVQVFSTLYTARFPISQMVPMSAFGGDDNVAAAADDTSSFDCRNAVAPGTPTWSMHAYGEAVDVNDVQNPYVSGAILIPPAGAAYLDRADVRPGMAVAGGVLVDAFAAVGWQWGGRWSNPVDYQHFSVNGR
jgi:hypothetical protein